MAERDILYTCITDKAELSIFKSHYYARSLSVLALSISIILFYTSVQISG